MRSVPVRYPESPVEVVDARDVAALAAELAEAAGLPKGGPGSGATARLTAPASPSHPAKGAPATPASASARQTLTALLESYGVSGHEGPVREEVLRRLPAWAKPEVDDKGNVTVRFGSGGKELVFVAHLDEVGFEVAAIRPDGSATLRTRGGMYLTLYEAHPVLVHAAKGAVPAVLAPREKYAEAKTAQPELEALALDFGTTSEAATRALGIAEGQSVTVRKELAPLFGTRTVGRSMDDRVGSTALLALRRRLIRRRSEPRPRLGRRRGDRPQAPAPWPPALSTRTRLAVDTSCRPTRRSTCSTCERQARRRRVLRGLTTPPRPGPSTEPILWPAKRSAIQSESPKAARTPRSSAPEEPPTSASLGPGATPTRRSR
jgi:hypothetical protein